MRYISSIKYPLGNTISAVSGIVWKKSRIRSRKGYPPSGRRRMGKNTS
jgi:hypothetical protein